MTRLPILAVAALALLRLVVGLHFFLEGLSHLRDPEWSSAGFRKAAVGPLAENYRAALPQVGDWAGTVGAYASGDAATALDAWTNTVEAGWRKLLEARRKAVPLDGKRLEAAEDAIKKASKDLGDSVAGIAADVEDYRLQLARIDRMASKPTADGLPFERTRIAKKRQEIAALSTGWMAEAEGLEARLVSDWDEPLSPEERVRAAAAREPTALWKADRFVSWSLLTIGACLVLGLFVKFNAMGGVFFLASVIASQPFWVAGAQPTYDQWVEIAALLTLAAMPCGGWCGLDHFIQPWLQKHCPFARCCGAATTTPRHEGR
jgi:uncharacterized membrane protein YphA (DoxX/SURF4 family)